MRPVLKLVGWGVLAVLGVALACLGGAHHQIRQVDPALPDLAELLAATRVSDGPVRLRYVNTASQPGTGPATICHPAFLLEWADGRAFLIDAGMEREAALEFGELGELAFGADPIRPHGSVREQLGDSADRIGGLAFTHLHTDHTNGTPGLCEAPGRSFVIFQTPWQADRLNYTTRPGEAHLVAADCAARARLEAGPVYTIPGFPGLVAVAAGGHTPGSTLYAARVEGRVWVLAGDVTNFALNLRENRPKPAVYSLLIVPEWSARLELLRSWLGALDAREGLTVLVSHDLEAIQHSGLPKY